ncbi:MAG: hypothetical protein ILO42_08895 [Clostridia bacterium]|nr:hypothetical protein [Clostridia bacterium]
MKKIKTRLPEIVLIAALALLALAAAGCGNGLLPGRSGSAEKTVRVVLACGEGITTPAENPRDVAPGSDVTFSYSVAEGYTVTACAGAELNGDGTLTVKRARYPVTVLLMSRELERCAIDLKISDMGDVVGDGAGQVSASVYECWEGETVRLSAEPAKMFGFAGYSLGKPLGEGGKLIGDSAEFDYVPVDSTPVYANFRRTETTIVLEDSPGLIKKSPDTLTAAVGSDVFFFFGLEDGYVIDEVPEGLTLERSTLTAENVGLPASYRLVTHQLNNYKLQIDQKPDGGTVTKTPDIKNGWDGTEVKLTAKPAEHHVFTGYSENGSLEGGAKLLCADPEYTFTLNKNTYIYANFELKHYTVTLNDKPGMTVNSPKEVTLLVGGTAEFDVTLSDGFLIGVLPDGTVYRDGKIILENVTADTVLDFEVYELSDFDVAFSSTNTKWGTVSSTLPAGHYREGTVISLSAKAGTGTFEGFSVGKPASAGGKIVATSTNYTFTVTADTVVYANFGPPPDPADTATVPAGNWAIFYHPNGGINTASGKDSYRLEYFQNTFYHCPNTLPNMGQFTREGYVLVGYNTKEDGTGTFYAPGWNVDMNGKKAISLWCVWMKETPASEFDYTVSTKETKLSYYKGQSLTTKTVTIRSYKGSAKTVVIPEKINGYPVTALSAATFTAEDIETLVISRYVQTVPASTMVSCTKFTTLYLSDSVTSMPDTWFSNSPNFSKLILMATRMPTYASGRNGTYAIKFDWLKTAPGKKLIIVSGSNSAYGIDSPMLETKLKNAGYEYSVVNYGQNASTPAAFYIEVCTNFMNPGDILVVAPELNKYQLGYNEINATLMQIFEGAYDAFSLVDIRHYIKMFATISAFNKTCSTRTPQNYYTFTSDTVNRWGDYSLNKVGATSSWKTTLDGYDNNGGKGTATYNTSTNCLNKRNSYSDSGRTLYYPDEINRVYDMAAARGATVLISFPTIVRTCLTLASQENGGTEQTNLINAVDRYLHGTRISVPSRYIFERQYSYNSNYHLNTAGQALRTGYISEDIIAYLKTH